MSDTREAIFEARAGVLREAVLAAMENLRDATPDIVEPDLFALGGPCSPREEADHALYHQVLLPALADPAKLRSAFTDGASHAE